MASESAEVDTVKDVQSGAASRGEPSLTWTDRDLLQYLATAWDQYDASHIQVIGRLRVAEEKTFGFLEELHHAETGIKLAAPSSGSKVHLGVFVPPPEIINFGEQWKEASYAVAALDLSSLQRREERNDPFACTVRPGSLAALSHVPSSWGVRTIDSDAVPLIVEMARMAIEERLEEETADANERLRTVSSEYEETAARLRLLNDDMTLVKLEIMASRERVNVLNADYIQRKEELDNKLRDLESLLRARGDRLVALDLIDKTDLETLLPSLNASDTRTGHDFNETLGGDFARLAPFIQARLWKRGMLFSQAQLRDFLALVRTHDLIVLAGDSGSGKTSLVREVAESIGGRCTVIPVKPNWTGPEDLLGYYNPIERSYQPTPFLQALQAAEKEPDVPHFICLDEMNLARVEYYFADFLSLLEARGICPTIPLYTSDEENHVVVENGLFLALEAEARLRSGLSNDATLEDILKNEQANVSLHLLGGFKDAESVLLHHARLRRALRALLRTPTSLRFPTNVRVIGAVNIDETTHYLSPKVLDRVHVLRFRNPLLTDWDIIESEVEGFDLDLDLPLRLCASELGLREAYSPFDRTNSDVAFLAGLARRQLDPLGVEFGLRAIRQATSYLHAARVAGIDDKTALDNVVQHKILPKLTLDTGRIGADGRNRRDILIALRDELAQALAGLKPGASGETSVTALDKLIASIDGNNGIANYWLR